MNLNDYILESVSDVDTLDIELAQLFAEMAVLEAMMDCYEKQIAILEYNEDSANEIFTETAQLMIMEDAKYKKEDLKIRKAKDGKWYIVLASDLSKIVEPTGFASDKAARNAAKHLFEPESKTEPLYKANPNPSDDFKEKQKERDAEANKPIKPREGSSKQFDGSVAVEGPKKSWSNTLKMYMSKAATAIQQLVLGLIDSIFEVNFNKLKDKVLDKGVQFEIKLNKNEFDQIQRLSHLIEKTDEYYENFSLDKLKSTNWTRAEVNRCIQQLRDGKSFLQSKFYLGGAENANDEGYVLDKDAMASICDKLGKNEFKKKLRKCQAEASKANIDYNSDNGIPAELGKDMREFVKYLIRAYNATTKTFTKVLKFAEEVGAKAMERSKNGGVDESPRDKMRKIFVKSKKQDASGITDKTACVKGATGMTGVSGEVSPDATGSKGITGSEKGAYDDLGYTTDSYQYSMDLDEDFF